MFLLPGTTAWILGDQLSLENPALDGADRVLLVESLGAMAAKRFHRQKLHLVLSAMRHFAEELRGRGLEVDVVAAGSLSAGLRAHRRRHHPDAVRLLAPKAAAGRARLSGLPGVEVVPGSLFLTDEAAFADWARGRKRLLMEDFYRDQRRRLGVLMDGERPAGGQWNFDPENRKPPPSEAAPPRPYRPREDAIDEAVRAELDALSERGALHPWGVDGPRLWPASHEQAQRALRRFVTDALPTFGPYQDAMLSGERFLWHSLLSSSLNLGLLSPLAVVRAAEAAFRAGDAPIASVEGFVRQVLGWREYVWGLYWLRAGEGWGNALEADSPLPRVLETGETSMHCLGDAVGGVIETAYAHHIERLMLFGNLMLLTGTAPDAALDWFHRCFIDGYDWVMAPNVLGMATWADGGTMMTKPYAASGRYVQRMSRYCRDCRYDPGVRAGDDACPFTTLYWDFLDRHRERLGDNRRMANMFRNLDRLDDAELRAVRRQAAALRANFDR